MLKGIGASSGIAIAKAFWLDQSLPPIPMGKVEDTVGEIKRLKDAVAVAAGQIKALSEDSGRKLGEEYGAIFDAHLMLLEDEELQFELVRKIETDCITAEASVKKTFDEYKDIFDDMEDSYMRERGTDIKDIGQRLLRVLLGVESKELNTLSGEWVILAKDLTPSDTAGMVDSKVKGFLTQIGGRTSHSAIMARTMEIPAVVGVGKELKSILEGDLLILDGDEGEIHVNPDAATLSAYQLKVQAAELRKQELKKQISLESITADGYKIEIAANIGKPEDAVVALAHGADGIGLFRTEFLYMNSSRFPSEEAQYLSYRRVLEAMELRPVIIRTLDIGGDKKLSYLPIEEELNPFLGYRAIRICLDQKEIFRTQLRALLRASAYGNLKIMFPMISGLEELLEAKAFMKEVREELGREGIPTGDPEVGIMIEIPSAAIISDVLAEEVDFFSIGTNDLIQYSIAVDRMNEKVSYLYEPYNLSILRLIKLTIDNAHAKGKWVGMCGEVAGEARLIPVLLGLGLDEFSMTASMVCTAREFIGRLRLPDCIELAKEVLTSKTSMEIKEKIEGFITEVEGRTKNEDSHTCH